MIYLFIISADSHSLPFTLITVTYVKYWSECNYMDFLHTAASASRVVQPEGDLYRT